MSGNCMHGVGLDTPCVKCALANAAGAPFDEAIQPGPRLDRRSSSLISEINAPVDPELTTRELLERADENLMWAISETRAHERARCRAIILELFGSEWSGNKALEWVDSGLTVEQLKEGK